MSKITTLILDAGGVLVYPLHGEWNIPVKYRELLGADAASIPGDAWRAALKKHLPILREDVPVSGMDEECTLRRKFLQEVARELKWSADDEAICALAQDFTWNVNRYVWYEDVLPRLEELHSRYRLGILSDSMPSFRHVVQSHPCHALLDALVISTEIGVGKPDPRMYQAALCSLNAAPEECIFVDDREGNLRGAMALGIRGVMMCRDGVPGWDGPVVRDLSELKSYLEGLN